MTVWHVARAFGGAVAALGVAALVLVAVGQPVHADGGPHGGYTPTTDACAACHRAHSAAAPGLTRDSTANLCFSCHGTAGAGADTDVKDGIYLERDGEADAEGIVGRGLRGGGFAFALMDTDVDGAATSAATTSTHIHDGGTGTLWGSGASGSGAGSAGLVLSCTNCHDPHGGAGSTGDPTYRLLRSIPMNSGASTPVDVTDQAAKVYTVADTASKTGNQYFGENYGAQKDQLSAWCAQCHTRYQATLGSGSSDSGDTIFSYRHLTTGSPDCAICHVAAGGFVVPSNPQNTEWGIIHGPTCVTCHVAHGSSAAMGGAAGTVAWPDGGTSPSGSERSSLLRLDDRGVCVGCHQFPSPVGGGDGGGGGGFCTSCHSQDMGSRRQIAGPGGDFDSTSHHVSGVVQDGDCMTCHEMSEHTQGVVRLQDPDLGPHHVYAYDPADPAALTPFCLSCHDADGAQAGGGLTPFTDGRTVPNVVGVPGSTWEGSAHRLGGVECSDCHSSNAHGADNIKLLQAPRVDTLCYACHTDGMVNNALAGPVDDIQEAFGQAERHDLGTTFVVGANTYEIQCSTCHNPHVVTGKHWDVDSGVSPVTRPDLTADPLINPRAMGTTLWGAAPGQKMDDFARQGSGSGGWYFSVARGGAIAFDQPAVYQPPRTVGGGWDNQEFSGDVLPDYTTLCLDCHSDRMSAANPPVNWGQGIACTDNSVDPPDQRIECGAQHGLAPANKPSYWGDVGLFGTSGNPDPIFAEPGVTRGRGAGHFMRWPYDSVDRNAGINFVMSCTDCHESHGSPVGSMLRTVVNDGPGTTIWNTSCNACHYYYGGQHAGMSCANASCHEANSIHRIIHVTQSGGTFLWTEPSRPATTPEIAAVQGNLGSNEFTVSFTQGVWTQANQTGALTAADFLFADVGGNNPRSILGVAHTPGAAAAIVTMTAAPDAPDDGADTLATRGIAVWDVDGDPAGPWPVTTTVCESSAGATFGLNEPAGSATSTDDTGLFEGTVGNPVFAFPGDGYFHGDEAEGTYVEFAGNPACLNSPRALTVEALVKPTEVDRNAGDLGVPDNTFNRIFERRRTMLVTILNTDYRGDDVPERAGKASIEVKYRVENVYAPGARHTCPNPQWPLDTYVGNDVRMHQISSDIDRWPLYNDHWYQIKVVFNSDKGPNHGTPVDIFIDDRGTDGLNSLNPTPLDPTLNPGSEQWPGYVNATKTISGSSSCRWGSLPGDVINDRDDTAAIGANWSGAAQWFEGQIDWVTWEPFADYSGVDDVANFGDPPTGVAAVPGGGAVQLSWDAMPDALDYNVYWATSPGVTRLSASRQLGASSPQTIAGLANGTGYYFVVTAVYADGESGPSSEVSATPAP